MYTVGEPYRDIRRYLSLNNSIRYSRKRSPSFLSEIKPRDTVQVPETEEHCTYAEQMNTERPQKPEL